MNCLTKILISVISALMLVLIPINTQSDCEVYVEESTSEVVTTEAMTTEIITTEAITTEVVTTEKQTVYLGNFKLTAYCPCYECSEGWSDTTSTGTKATQGRTIAVDKRVIPYGSTVIINGNEYVAEDCGGAIKGNRIDVYFNNHDEALEFGVQYADVYVKS